DRPPPNKHLSIEKRADPNRRSHVGQVRVKDSCEPGIAHFMSFRSFLVAIAENGNRDESRTRRTHPCRDEITPRSTAAARSRLCPGLSVRATIRQPFRNELAAVGRSGK